MSDLMRPILTVLLTWCWMTIRCQHRIGGVRRSAVQDQPAVCGAERLVGPELVVRMGAFQRASGSDSGLRGRADAGSGASLRYDANGAGALMQPFGAHWPPSEQECDDAIRAGDRDWSRPMGHMVSKYRRVPNASLPDRLTHDEWVQMHYTMQVVNDWELAPGSAKVYQSGVRHFADFLQRYPLEELMGPQHRHTGVLLDPAVWRPTEVEKILIDFVLHEHGWRGNKWSTVRGKVYALRHHNIRHGCGNILQNKFRYQQVLRGIKKKCGPQDAKHPVTQAMMLAISRRLDLEKDDDLVLFAA